MIVRGTLTGRSQLVEVSVVEYIPANIVAAGLVFQDEVAKTVGNLPSLPVALSLACLLFLSPGSCGLNRLNSVGSGTEVVFRNVSNAGSLTRCVRRKARSAAQRAGSAHGMPADRTGVHHFCLAASPSPCRFNCLTRSGVSSIRFLEQRQHLFGADGRPYREKFVVGFGERPTTADAHETRVANSGEDHRATLRRQHVATATQSGVCAVPGSRTSYATSVGLTAIVSTGRVLGMMFDELVGGAPW